MSIIPTLFAGLRLSEVEREDYPKEVLVVDDHHEITAMIAEALSEEGYRIRVAHDGAAALREVQRRRPDLILMDVAMPTMRGDQAIRRMRAQGLADIPVLLMTADPRPERFGGLGARKIIGKPFDLARLLDLIRQCL